MGQDNKRDQLCDLIITETGLSGRAANDQLWGWSMVQKPRMYNEFIAISWSGHPLSAGQEFAPVVARFGPEDDTPRVVPNPFGGTWRRSHVAGWLLGLVLSERPILVGLDFPFSLPFCDKKTYFPGSQEEPEGLIELWQLVAQATGDDPDLLGDGFINDERFNAYFGHPSSGSSKFEDRHRICETMFAPSDRPESVFLHRDDDSVAARAVSGIRMIRTIRNAARKTLAVWPLDRPRPGQPTFVETHPAMFWGAAGFKISEVGPVDSLNAALRSFQAQTYMGNETELLPRVASAVLSAAAIKQYMKQTESWLPKKMTDPARRFEGWIFGAN